jgi:tetraacyldisaccharide 4'-kinase
VIVTRKTASAERARELADRFAPMTATGASAACLLRHDELVDAVDGSRRPLTALAGMRMVGVAAVGAPRAFVAQLEAHGLTVLDPPRAYGDHHRFTDADVHDIVRRASGLDGVVCTLKDAVKLGPRWPRAAPSLWYVSQRVVVEYGGPALDASIETILRARAGFSSTAGTAG